MRVINKTKNTILARDAVVAQRLIPRTKGLLDRTTFKLGEGLIIKPCKSVHTYFMLFPIDVLFVNKENKVIRAISNLQPFRVTAIVFKAAYVIELPAGTLQRTDTVESDLLLLE